jgi:hypothetical protein
MESGKPSADQVHPLDKWGRGGTIFKLVGAKIHGVGQEYSWSSSPCKRSSAMDTPPRS